MSLPFCRCVRALWELAVKDRFCPRRDFFSCGQKKGSRPPSFSHSLPLFKLKCGSFLNHVSCRTVSIKNSLWRTPHSELFSGPSLRLFSKDFPFAFKGSARFFHLTGKIPNQFFLQLLFHQVIKIYPKKKGERDLNTTSGTWKILTKIRKNFPSSLFLTEKMLFESRSTLSECMRRS